MRGRSIGPGFANGRGASGLFPNFLHRDLIAELALDHRLPSISWWADFVETGQVPMAYAAYFPDYADRFVDVVGQILASLRPNVLPAMVL